jgi:nitroreductase
MLKAIRNFFFLFTGKPVLPQKVRFNETIDLILRRRSCRSFYDEEIDEKDFRIILEAGRFAPSTVNLQTWSFITFTRSEWETSFQRPIPFKGVRAIVVCADIHRLKHFFPDFQQTPFVNLSFAIFNAGLAAMNMTTAAEAVGLNSIMLSETGKTGLLDYSYLKEKLNLSEGVIPLTTIVLGKSKTKSFGIPPRQPWNAIVMERKYVEAGSEMLKDWFQQMFIGFKLTHPFSDFRKQIEYYRKKMVRAEESLKKQFL